MSKKATSVYLTVSFRDTHKTALHKMFFNMAGLNKFIAEDAFKDLYPLDVYYITKEIY
jgi:hypothetical protein